MLQRDPGVSTLCTPQIMPICLAFEFYIYQHIITKLPDLQSQECTTYYVPEEIETQVHICLPMIATQPVAISKSSLKLWQHY